MAKGAGNLSLLVRNTCDGLTDGGQKIYLDLLDRYQGWSNRAGELQAFAEANLYDENIGNTLSYILDHGPIEIPASASNDHWKQDLHRYFAERWKNNFMENA